MLIDLKYCIMFLDVDKIIFYHFEGPSSFCFLGGLVFFFGLVRGLQEY